MKHTYLFKIVVLILFFAIICGLAGVQTVRAQGVETADLLFSDLGVTAPLTLSGPFTESDIRFNLPPGWKAEGIVKIEIDLMAYFSSLVATETGTTVSGLVGGDFSLLINDTLADMTTLQESGQQTLQFEFDANLLKSAAEGGSNNLLLRWDGSISCQSNLLSSVTVTPLSRISFQYTEVPVTLSLNDFPVPFYVEQSIRPVTLVIVLPDEPSPAELNAGVNVAAGIGQITGHAVQMDVIPYSEFRSSINQSRNVILVASSETLKSGLFASERVSGQLKPAENEGVLHLYETENGVGLLVSGDDVGIGKAAQVLAANQILAAGDERTMYISSVNPPPPSIALEDMTLQEMGVGELVFAQPDATRHSFDFYVPAGNQVRADATFDLIISHSQQLDYLRSGLQMRVNGYPAVSLRLTDNTSNEALFKLILPTNLIHVGRNEIEFEATLSVRDLCTPASAEVAWLRISSNSLMHLPLESAIGGSKLPVTFEDFPDIFHSEPGLNNVIIVVAPSEFAAIQSAAKLAGVMGASLPQNAIIQMSTFYADAQELAEIGEKSLLLIGKPSDFKGYLSNFPSLVFDGQNLLTQKSAIALVNRPEANTNIGYLAVRGFSAASSQVMLAVLGNTAEGIDQAVELLINDKAGKQNFVITAGSNEQVGWLDQGIATGKIAVPVTEEPSDDEPVNPVQSFKAGMYAWAVPVLAVLLAVALLFLYIEIRQSIKKG